MSAGRAIGLLLGVAADGVLGQPKHGRPVGKFAGAAETLAAKAAADRPLAGLLHAGGLAGGAILLGVLGERVGRHGPAGQAAVTAVATWVVLDGARLAVTGTELARELETGDLDAVRDSLAGIDPRCAADLRAIGLSRAAVEAVAGNTADVVVAPLAWGAVAGVPGLLGVRALSVLREVVGRSSPGRHRFGRAALLADQVANLLPSRAAAALTVLAAPVVGGDAAAAWRAWRRDTVIHPSPNEGRVQAAFAGALEIRLGGRTVYPAGTEDRPVLGDGRNPDAGHLTRAVELSRVVGWLAAGTAAVVAVSLGARRS